jgi:hypothetical protein
MSATSAVPKPRFASATEWRDLVERFERAELATHEWDHTGHLAVATWYLLWYDDDEALTRVRDGIRRLNAVHEKIRPPKVGYHETLTRFYMRMVRVGLSRYTVGSPLVSVVNAITVDLADRALPLEYYSHERLFSTAARGGWIEPDLRPLP